MNRFRHLVGTTLVVGVALAGAACGDQGRYKMTWRLVGEGALQAPGEPTAARHCGLHGLDALAISGSNDGGDDERATAACAALSVDRQVPVGDWTLLVTGLGRNGKPLEADPASPLMHARPAFTVTSGETTDVVIDLPVLPTCRDGVDNDGDGTVDVDDPTCGGASGGSET